MKKLTRLFAAVAALALFHACADEMDFTPDSGRDKGPVFTITASVDDASTKTFLDEDGQIEWNAGDAVSLLEVGDNFKFETTESGLRAKFTHTGEMEEKAYYALYPYNASAVFAGGVVTTSIPTVQSAAAGAFSNLALAWAEWGKPFYFKNAAAWAKVSFKTTDTQARIRKVTVRSLDESVLLSGTVTLTPTLEDGAITDVTAAVTDGVPYASYEAAEGEILSPETDYYILVAPSAPDALAAGYRVEFETEGGVVFSKDYAGEAYKSAQFKRNTIAPVGRKNLDAYQTAMEAYWRITETAAFTEGSYLFAYDKGDGAYRIFNEAKTDAWTGSGSVMMQKFYDKDFPSDKFEMILGGWLTALNNTKSAWSNGNTPAWMSHFVLYAFRNSYLDAPGSGISYAGERLILNPNDACAILVNADKTASFKLYYKDKTSGSATYNKTISTQVELTQCSPVFDGSDAKLTGYISETSIDGLVDIIFNGKGSNWNSAMTPSEIKQTAVKACDELTTIGYCTTEQSVADGSTLNNQFMLLNKYLCTVPKTPASFGLYKKDVQDLTYQEYVTINNNK